MRRIASLQPRVPGFGYEGNEGDASTSAGDGEINKSKGKCCFFGSVGGWHDLVDQSHGFFACHEPGRACACVRGS